jgi:hypothetical protein
MEDNKIIINALKDTNSFLRLNRFVMTRTKRAIGFWLGPVIFFILGITLVLIDEAVTGVIFMLLAPTMLGMMLFLNRIIAKRMLKTAKFYSDRGNITFELNENVMVYKTGTSSISIKWEDFYRVYETNYSFYLMQDNIQCFIIDKKYLSEVQAKRIKELLKEKLGVKKFRNKVNKNKAIKYIDENTEINVKELINTDEPPTSEVNYDVTLTTTMNFGDFMKFNYFHLFKGFNKVIVMVFPLIFWGISALNYFEGDYVGVIVFVVLGILIVPSMMFFTRILVKKNFKSSKYLKSITDVFLGINSDGLTQATQISSSQFKWHEVYRAYEQKKYFYIYVSSRQAVILPKADFEEGGIEKLRQVMNANLTKKQNKFEK